MDNFGFFGFCGKWGTPECVSQCDVVFMAHTLHAQSMLEMNRCVYIGVLQKVFPRGVVHRICVYGGEACRNTDGSLQRAADLLEP